MCDQSTCKARSHDSAAAYTNGCRSGSALADYRRYEKAGRLGIRPPRIVPALGTVRRLQALVALGYSNLDLAERLDINTRHFAQLVLGKVPEVKASTQASVKALFVELGTTPGPNERARKRGAERGWPVPLMWEESTIDDPHAGPVEVLHDRYLIDEVKVQRAIAGNSRLAELNQAERNTVILRTALWSAAVLADRLHCTERTVVRIRARVRAVQAPPEAA